MRPRAVNLRPAALLLAGIVASTVLALATPARADVRDDARRAFRQGMTLISEGQNLEGIEFLQKAYDLLPHPSVLYNIGLTYANAGEYGSALDYFQRYLDTGPEDGAAVESLMALLESQMQDDAAAAEIGGGGDAGSGGGDAGGGGGQVAATPEVLALIERLEALAARMEGGGEPVAVAPTEEAIDADALESRGDIYEEVVVSASRQASAPVDAPVATTVITADEIRLSGATNIPDLLRRVPGMSVLTMGSGNANLAVRGFNQRISNKVLVLVDGRSAYLDFLGGTFFKTLSIDLQDIERIEVIRGPNSTLYGANAFGGVVNIITKQPDETRPFGGSVHVTAGSGETILGNARFGGRSGILRYRGSIGYEQTSRYELTYGERADVVATTDDPKLAVRGLRANGGLRITPTPNISLGLSGGLNYSYDSFMAIGVFRNFWMRGLFSDVRFDAQFGGLGIRVFWNHMNAEADQTWLTVGGASLATHPVAHVVDVEAIYSGRALTGPVQHDLAVGAGYRLKTIDWSYIDEPHVEQHLHGFVEDRITFIPQLVTVLGFRFDQHPLVGFTPSPRGALLIKPTPGQALRISAGTAFRTPTFTESYLDLVIPSGVVTGVGIQSRGNPDLEPENIFSATLGYTFEDSDFVGFQIEGWYQRVGNLIALGNIQSGEGAGPRIGTTFVVGESAFQNNDSVFHGLGGEAEIHAFPVDGLDIRGAYSFAYFIDQERKDAGEDDFRDRRHPMHSGYVGASYRSPIGLDIAADLHIVSAVVIPERTFDAATGQAINEDCDGDAYAMVSARLGQRLLDDKLEFGISAFNIPGFFTGGHREHCLGTRVGPRVLGSATYRF